MTPAPWRRATTALWRRTSSAVVVLPRGASDPLRLEGAAALLWDVLEEPTTLDEASDLLARACGVDVSTVRTDLDHVAVTLGTAGAIEESQLPC